MFLCHFVILCILIKSLLIFTYFNADVVFSFSPSTLHHSFQVSDGGPLEQAGRCNSCPAESRRGLHCRPVQRHPQPVRTSAQRASLSHRHQFLRFWIGHQPNSTNGKENFPRHKRNFSLCVSEPLNVSLLLRSKSCTVISGTRKRNACVFFRCASPNRLINRVRHLFKLKAWPWAETELFFHWEQFNLTHILSISVMAGPKLIFPPWAAFLRLNGKSSHSRI